jgi:hypothetical protein
VLLPGDDLADRRGDLCRREHRGRDLVQQGLEEVVVAPVDHRHLDRRSRERTNNGEATEAAADDDDLGNPGGDGGLHADVGSAGGLALSLQLARRVLEPARMGSLDLTSTVESEVREFQRRVRLMSARRAELAWKALRAQVHARSRAVVDTLLAACNGSTLRRLVAGACVPARHTR